MNKNAGIHVAHIARNNQRALRRMKSEQHIQNIYMEKTLKKSLEIVTACLVTVMSLIGCGGGAGSSSTNTGTDAIAITNISPASAVAGASTVFSVDVSYTLASKNSGELAVGFNTNPSQPGSFYLDSTQKFLVTKGSGTHTFVSTATPVAGTFMVSVDLSENPHPIPWSPLASDMRTIGKK